ncbi:reprolysin-like metallopeptidase [Taibaiella chishuiensis]|uniref:Putative secreted protein (Por secretion system target) n=1 Tax=Taibaiella chishuiensis TaxID=1434707 RepID=A0A2P8CSR7_9BACT|nr:zinc-dependent metalloprotease family protein [Taibaiella chishuiensis]PSK88006.1 putative secreted protein (Por secretion system target) [Taibaiella chishuiensis]
MKRKSLAIAWALALPLLSVRSYAADFWKPFEGTVAPSKGEQILKPDHYKLQTLNQTAVFTFLSGLSDKPEQAGVLALPTPEGKTQQFLVWKTPVMEAGLQARYPGIQTFTARAADNPAVTAKIDYTLNGFHAMVFDKGATYMIDPYSNTADGYYTVYYKQDYRRPLEKLMPCAVGGDELKDAQGVGPTTIDGTLPPLLPKSHGNTRKKYRLAVSCTGEYAQAVGGATPTKVSVLSAMVTTMNRVNGIYEREAAVTMEMIGNNDTLIFLNPTSDPFNNNDLGDLLDENQVVVDQRIGTANYDIGHVFSTSPDGGLASLGCVCRTGGKARGGTGSPNPVGDAYDVDYVAHEMGHQFGANHTFNFCSGNENQTTAYEPGGGTTIMAYAGICGFVNNVQNNSDAYFHNKSLDEMSSFITTGFFGGGGPTCGVGTANYTPPVLPAIQATYTIPYKTPFELQAPQATIGQSDTMEYCWEQWDLGNYRQSENRSDTFQTGPSFRSFFPDTSRVRIFPRINYVLTNTIAYKGERLPAAARTLKFKVSARSIVNGWGAFSLADDVVTATVINTGTPFRVTAPNTNTTLTANTNTTITWDVAQTDAAPINTPNVDIFLSTDGGYTFPYTLATGVPNTGSASILIPGHNSTTARIKVKGAGNIFFDISDQNFTITGGTSLADITLEQGLSLYPNPASNEVTVKHAGTGKLNLVLYNAVGQKVWQAAMDNEIVIPVQNLARGMYYLQCHDDRQGGTATKRISLK